MDKLHKTKALIKMFLCILVHQRQSRTPIENITRKRLLNGCVVGEMFACLARSTQDLSLTNLCLDNTSGLKHRWI